MAEERNLGIVKRKPANDTKYKIDYELEPPALSGSDGTLVPLPHIYDTTNTVVEYNPTLAGYEVYGYGVRRDGTVVEPNGNTFKLPIPSSTDNKTYDLTIENNRVTTPNNSNAQYRRLSHNSFTKLGILHLDFTPLANLGTNAIITRLPAGVPKPTTLIEVMASGMNNGNGTVWINTNGVVYSNGLTQGNRYILNLIGYFE